jgi:hypothetical protein
MDKDRKISATKKRSGKNTKDLLALSTQNIELCPKNYRKLVQKQKMA